MSDSASNHPGLKFAKGKPPTQAHRSTARKQKTAETAHMRTVRHRDRDCRWPECPCHRRLNPTLEVAHLTHRGMGGNPAGDRSEPHRMILLDRETHQALDAGTLKITPQTRKGTAGPCAYFVKGPADDWTPAGKDTGPPLQGGS
jgi:hypothetical protein